MGRATVGLGLIGLELWFPWQQIAPLGYNRENGVPTLYRLSDPFYTKQCHNSRTLLHKQKVLKPFHSNYLGKMVSKLYIILANLFEIE